MKCLQLRLQQLYTIHPSHIYISFTTHLHTTVMAVDRQPTTVVLLVSIFPWSSRRHLKIV